MRFMFLCYNGNALYYQRSFYMKDNKKKRDLLLVIGILVIAGGFYIGNLMLNRKPAVMVEVSVDGTVVEQLDLSKDTEVTIESRNGGTNHLVIQDGQVFIDDASCPDKVCIHQGKISKNGDMIVCLPNLMIAKVVGEEK